MYLEAFLIRKLGSPRGILIRVTADLELIPGTLGRRWESILDGIPVRTHTFIHT